MKRLCYAASAACLSVALFLAATTTARGQDLTTQLSFFLQQLANGSLSFPLGTGASGKITAQSDGVFTLLNAAGTSFGRLQFGGTTSSFVALKPSGTNLLVRLADDSGAGGIQAAIYFNTGGMLISSTAPTISSGFGTSPSIVSSNGTASFRVNVGTGGAATSGVIGLPTATNGWNCQVADMTTNVATRQSASTTTTATFTAAAAWTASDILTVSCFAF